MLSTVLAKRCSGLLLSTAASNRSGVISLSRGVSSTSEVGQRPAVAEKERARAWTLQESLAEDDPGQYSEHKLSFAMGQLEKEYVC